MSDTRPYDRRTGESDRAFEAFALYRDSGPPRSIEAVAETLAKSGSLLRRWSSSHDWVARCAAFDADRDRAEQEAKAKVREEEAAKWQRRRLQSAKDSWRSSQRLLQRAFEMLDGPLLEEKSEGGLTVKKPVKWTMGTAAAMLKIAAELRSAALADALGGDDDDFDPGTATPEECRAYLQRVGILTEKGQMKGLPGPSR